jgi:hypothetical protein
MRALDGRGTSTATSTAIENAARAGATFSGNAYQTRALVAVLLEARHRHHLAPAVSHMCARGVLSTEAVMRCVCGGRMRPRGDDAAMAVLELVARLERASRVGFRPIRGGGGGGGDDDGGGDDASDYDSECQ